MSDIVCIGNVKTDVSRVTVNCYRSWNDTPIVEIESPWARLGILVENVDPLIELLKKAQTYWEVQASLSASLGDEEF